MDTEEVKRRQDAVSCFLQTNNAETAQSLSKLVRGAKNVARLLTMLSRDVADVNIWKHLAEVRAASGAFGVAQLEMTDTLLFFVGRKQLHRCSTLSAGH